MGIFQIEIFSFQFLLNVSSSPFMEMFSPWNSQGWLKIPLYFYK